MEESLQKAIRDIEAIRRAIEQADGSERSSGEPWELRLQIGLAAASGVTLLFELLTSQTTYLLASISQNEIRYVGVVSAGMLLLLLGVIFHRLVRFAADKSDVPLERFVERHFLYLRNFSLFTDLIIKYFVFAIVVLAKAPQLVAPLFFLFIADYLFQGRLFVLPLRSSSLLAVSALALATVQFALDVPDLSWPLAYFVLVSLCSVAHLSTTRSKQIGQ